MELIRLSDVKCYAVTNKPKKNLVKAALYSSTDVANLYLAQGSAKSLHDMIVYQSQTIYPLWNNMVDAIRLVASAGRRSYD